MKKIFVSGAAGFIGFHLVKRLCEEKKFQVVGIDNLNSYYSIDLKQARLRELKKYKNFTFYKTDIQNKKKIFSLFQKYQFDIVVHLAAQAGVRFSLENPMVYGESNVMGFLTILEACRAFPVKHCIYASSSSVYGNNKTMPFSEKDRVDHPVSLYAATKKSNELMAHCYAYLFKIPITGLRFFTVYGPWGRPDMSYYLFANAITKGQPISVYNKGNMLRDFTYVEDIADGIYRVLEAAPKEDKISKVRYKIYNIGNNKPVKLLNFIQLIESELGKKAKLKMLPMQPGDVYATFADINNLRRDTGFKPRTPLPVGIKKFIAWYKDYYGIK